MDGNGLGGKGCCTRNGANEMREREINVRRWCRDCRCEEEGEEEKMRRR